MEIKFSEEEVKEIVKKHALNMLYTYQQENKVFEVADHYGNFTVTISDKPGERGVI